MIESQEITVCIACFKLDLYFTTYVDILVRHLPFRCLLLEINSKPDSQKAEEIRQWFAQSQ